MQREKRRATPFRRRHAVKNGGHSKSNGGGNSVAWPENPSEKQQSVPWSRQRDCVNLPQVFVFRVAAFPAAPRARGARGATVVAYKKQAKWEDRQTADTHSKTSLPRKAPGCGRVAKVSQAKCLLPVNQSLLSRLFFFFFSRLVADIRLCTSFFSVNKFCMACHQARGNLSKKGWSLRYIRTLPESFLRQSPCFKRLSHQFPSWGNLPS